MSEDLSDHFRLDLLPQHIVGMRVADLVDLTGKRAVVTGGGGPNLGQAIVHRLAGQGADVAVVDTDEGAAAKVAEDATRWGTTTISIGGDVSDWDGAHAVVDQVTETLGPIDIWVNNVGGGAGVFMEQSKADIDAIVSRTLLSTLYSTRAVLDPMIRQGSGRIINIASEGGKMASPGIIVYNACKSAVIGFTRNLAHEIGKTGVSIVAVCPGMMLGEGLQYSLRHPEEYRERLMSMTSAFERIALGRGCLPEEVANVVAFLASEAGGYIVGTAVSVGGGMSDS